MAISDEQVLDAKCLEHLDLHAKSHRNNRGTGVYSVMAFIPWTLVQTLPP